MTRGRPPGPRAPSPPRERRGPPFDQVRGPSPAAPAAHRPTPPASQPEEVTFGLRAGLAVWVTRPRDVRSLAFANEALAQAPELEHALHAADAAGVAVTRRSPDELARLAGSDHHEGLVVEAAPRRYVSASELGSLLASSRGVALALDRVRNPYNVGAVLRSAAFLGAEAVILGAQAPHPALTPQAARVAEGGAEHVALARTTDLAQTLSRLREAGVLVVGADGAATTRLPDARLSRPVVLVVGNEREGLSPRVRAACERVVAIPGTGRVESLNVAVAASLLLSAALSGPAGLR